MDRIMTDPTLQVMIGQTLIYTATLCALIYQIRAQTRATRTVDYNRCASDYSALIRMMVEQPALHSIYDDLAKIEPSGSGWLKYDSRQKLLFNYIELTGC